jgi:hypothetical protein
MSKLLFERWRKFLSEDEEVLLIEGRKEDAKKAVVKNVKYEQVAKELEKLLDTIIEADPSGNQKYLGWAARRLNSRVMQYIKNAEGEAKEYDREVDVRDIEDNIRHYTRRIASTLPKYHKFASMNLIDKNIDKFKDLGDFEHQVYNAEKEFNERETMRKLEKGAKETSDVVMDTDDVMMVRPRSTEGSCYYGRGTHWCISYTRAQNYFDQYTGEGKAFYMVLFKHLPEDMDNNKNKKMALVYSPGNDYEPEEIYDAADDEVGYGGLEEAVKENLLAKGFMDSSLADVGKKLKGDKKTNYFKTGKEQLQAHFDTWRTEFYDQDTFEIPRDVKLAFDALGIDIEPDEDLSSEQQIQIAIETFDEKVSEELNEITGYAGGHFQENPAGPTLEEFQSIIDEYEWKHVGVNVDEYDEGKYYWNSSTSFDFSDVDDMVDDPDTDDMRDIILKVLDDNYFYPEDLDVNDWRGSVEVYANFSPSESYTYGGSRMDEFRSFVEENVTLEEKYEVIYEEILEAFRESGLIMGQTIKDMSKRFEDLELDHFEVTPEGTEVELSTQLPIQILLPPEIIDASKSTPTDEEKAIYDRITKLIGKHINLEIKNEFLKHLQGVFEKAYQAATKQMELPLSEEEGVQVPVNNVTLWLTTDKAGSMPKGGGPGVPHKISDHLTFGYALDIQVRENTEEEVNAIERFIKILDKPKFLEYTRELLEGLVNNKIQKVIVPQIRKELKDTEELYDLMSESKENLKLFTKWRNMFK